MRDWSLAFRRASFRGAGFWVEDDGSEGGRRVAVHLISGGEATVTEDMGPQAVQFRVSAYVASDLADAEGLMLEAACRAPGPSMLVLPMDAAFLAHCLGCRRNRARDRNGYVAYDLTFVEGGESGLFPVTSLAALRNVFGVGLAAAASSLAGAFA